MKTPLDAMPALSAKTKHYYRERIRSILVQNPQTISVSGAAPLWYS
jgi:hypothetical protein